MNIRLQTMTYVLALAASFAWTPQAKGDVAADYQKTLAEIDKLETQIAKAIEAKDVDAFLSHFAVVESERQSLHGWFVKTAKSWQADELDHVEVNLPLLAVASSKALAEPGCIDIHLRSGTVNREGWSPLVLERRGETWVVISEELSPLDPPVGVQVTHAEFDVTPRPESKSVIVNVLMTVENKTSTPLTRIPIYIRHPLVFDEITWNDKPLEANVTFGTIDGRPLGLITAISNEPLAPGNSARLRFRYTASYDFHRLGRKPVGYTTDRGFVLWESGWYPHFTSAWKRFPYDMRIRAPRGCKALTSGELLSERDDGDTHVSSFRTTRPEAPYFLWGRYKETPCDTGDVKMTIWTPIEHDIDPQPMAKMVREAFDVFSDILPPPALDQHRVVAVTRYGGYGPIGNLLLHDPTFTPEAIAQTSTLDFVAHELSHSWVNSLASPQGDPPSFLAEGLATYLGAKAVEKSRGEQAAREVWAGNLAKFTKDAAKAVAPMDLTERIRDENNPMFRAVAYYKAAFMFRELETLVGEKIIFRALEQSMLENKGEHFTLEDFQKRIDCLTKKKLAPFWDRFLRRAAAPDYALVDAGPGDSLNSVRIINRGTLTPTPVEIAAYDANMRELARKRVVIKEAEGRGIEFKASEPIARVVIDPDKRVCQQETRNDTYPDCVLPKDDVAVIESMMTRMLKAMRQGDVETLSDMLADDPALLETALRERMLAGMRRQSKLAVTKDGPVCIYRTGDDRAVATFAVTLKQGETSRRLLGEFSLANSPNGWKLIMMRLA